jgi:hypothetical protein
MQNSMPEKGSVTVDFSLPVDTCPAVETRKIFESPLHTVLRDGLR